MCSMVMSHGPFVRSSFEIPLGRSEIFDVHDDGVARLFEIRDAFIAIGLGERLRRNGGAETSGGAEQQDYFFHSCVSSVAFLVE